MCNCITLILEHLSSRTGRSTHHLLTLSVYHQKCALGAHASALHCRGQVEHTVGASLQTLSYPTLMLREHFVFDTILFISAYVVIILSYCLIFCAASIFFWLESLKI